MSKLVPTVTTNATLGDDAFDGVRRRPVVAIDDEGQLVICCRRTATKNGWKVEGTLFKRDRKVKAAETTKAKAKGKTKASEVEDLL